MQQIGAAFELAARWKGGDDAVAGRMADVPGLAERAASALAERLEKQRSNLAVILCAAAAAAKRTRALLPAEATNSTCATT